MKTGEEEIDYNCARKNHTEWELILKYLFLFHNVCNFISKKDRNRLILLGKKEFGANPIQIELPSGACFLIKKDLMYKIRGFDPNTFLYMEESILYKKISALALNNYLDPTVSCIHLGASSTKKATNSFILKVGLNSTEYYLNNYCNLKLFQKIVFNCAKIFFLFKILINRFSEKFKLL